MNSGQTAAVRTGGILGLIAGTSFARRTVAAFLVTLAVSSATGQAQTVEWARSAGGNGRDDGAGIAVDDAGNSYVTGGYEGMATFGSFTLTSAGEGDVFVAKYDAGGRVIWARSGGGLLGDQGYGIAVDAAGNSYVTGWYEGTASFGATTLTSTIDRSAFVIKYDTNGNVLWAVSAGGNSSTEGAGIAIDLTGHCYVTGRFLGTPTFDPFKLTGAGGRDIFVAKYDTQGSAMWVRAAGGVGGDGGISIAVDDAGNSYVTGYYDRAATFGPFILTSDCYPSCIFVVKYDAGGNALWARLVGGSGYQFAQDIAADAVGNCYVTGRYGGAPTFGTFTLKGSGDDDFFLVKYDTDGSVLWAKSAGGTVASAAGWGVATDTEANSYVTGFYGGTATFGPITLPSADEWNIFAARYDAGGNVVWAESSRGVSGGYVLGTGIDVDTSGHVHMIGNYRGTVTFGPFALTSVASYYADIFVARYNSNCPPAGCVCNNSCGDINGDASGVSQPNASTDLLDYALFANCFGLSPNHSQNCFCSDLNGDGEIDRTDFAILVDYFESVSQSTPPNCP